LKVTRNKNKRRDSDGSLKPRKLKRICKGWSNKGMLGVRHKKGD
tara:strand:+ start:288 stop:419 length:132 start_codon:yes stop_codon:yes gene_type:complete